MDKLWVVIKREYLERVRSRWFIFSTIFGPVFFAAITILPGYLTMKGMKNADRCRASASSTRAARGSGTAWRSGSRSGTTTPPR